MARSPQPRCPCSGRRFGRAHTVLAGPEPAFQSAGSGRARCVPDGAVNPGDSRSLRSKPRWPPTWSQAGRTGNLNDLLSSKSRVLVHALGNGQQGIRSVSFGVAIYADKDAVAPEIDDRRVRMTVVGARPDDQGGPPVYLGRFGGWRGASGYRPSPCQRQGLPDDLYGECNGCCLPRPGSGWRGWPPRCWAPGPGSRLLPERPRPSSSPPRRIPAVPGDTGTHSSLLGYARHQYAGPGPQGKQRGSALRRANGFANETGRDGEDLAGRRIRPPTKALASETHRHLGDQEDARRGAHNPATTGLPVACPMGRSDTGNRGHSRDEHRDRDLHERWSSRVQSQPSKLVL